MYVDAEIDTGSGEPVLAVPESAVMDTGSRQAVFVDKGEGRFEPREVKLGHRGDGYVEVREGIAEGEPVVVSANFLIDAESNLKAALKGFSEAGAPAMIARLIAWSARNLLLVLFGTGFAAAAGIYALIHLPLDAIPDLSDTQVIVYTEYPGQAPQVIEDQVTYPLTTAMLTVPKSKVVRGFSFFGVSFVYVIFEDGTDIYWARSRVLEFLNGAASRLPAGVTPTIGPDATGVGWVYQYAVMSKELNLADTRAIQDWNLKFALAKAEGVAEVASVGGFVKQYNVILDPQRMRDLGITMQKMRDAIRASNADVGGRTVELSEFEYVIRGKGYIKSINDLGNIVLKTSNGTPVLLRDVARVELGPDERRGITELNGEGEVASGIVLQRFGVNALDVIENVKKRFKEIASSLPKSVEIVPVYDRSNLIYAAIDTLKHTLFEESVVVALVCIVFLLHVRSALVAILMLPVGVLMAFGAMKLLGPRLQHHEPRRHRDRDRRHGRCGDRHDRERPQAPRTGGARTVARRHPDRGGVRGRAGAVLQPADHHRVVHADLHAGIAGRPAVQPARVHQDLLDGGGGAAVGDAGAGADGDLRARPDHSRAQESDQPLPDLDLSPSSRACMRAKTLVILLALAVLAVSIWPARQLGTEFMPNLNEGTLLYMPTTLPGISVTKAAELLQTQDRIIRSFPEVASVYGKAGPRRDRDRSGAVRDVRDRHQSEAEGAMAARRDGRQPDRGDGQGAAISRRLQCLDHADQGPHRHAVDRHPHAGRRQGDRHRSGRDRQARQADRAGAEGRARHVVGLCRARHRRLLSRDRRRTARRWRATASWSRTCRTRSRPRSAARRVTTTVEGRQRFTVNMRYPRDLRDNPQVDRQRRAGADAGRRRRAARRSGDGRSRRAGRRSIRTENGQLATYIYVDIRDRDLGGYVADAQRAVHGQHPVPAGLLRDVERPVRISRTRHRAPEDRRAGDAADHLPAAVPQLPLDHRNPDRDAVAAVRAGRRALADVVARLQPVGRGRGRLHRARRRRRRDRRRDADLSQSGPGRDQGAARRRGPRR